MCLIVDVFNLYVNIVNMVICVTIMVICVMVMVTDNSFVLVIYATEKATLWHTLSTIINKRHCRRTKDHQIQPYMHDSNPDNLAP
jgi:hypothetical protein